MKLLIQSPVEHDGRIYTQGETLTIKNDEQGAALVASGCAIEFVAEAKKAKAETTEASE